MQEDRIAILIPMLGFNESQVSYWEEISAKTGISVLILVNFTDVKSWEKFDHKKLVRNIDMVLSDNIEGFGLFDRRLELLRIARKKYKKASHFMMMDADDTLDLHEVIRSEDNPSWKNYDFTTYNFKIEWEAYKRVDIIRQATVIANIPYEVHKDCWYRSPTRTDFKFVVLSRYLVNSLLKSKLLKRFERCGISYGEDAILNSLCLYMAYSVMFSDKIVGTYKISGRSPYTPKDPTVVDITNFMMELVISFSSITDDNRLPRILRDLFSYVLYKRVRTLTTFYHEFLMKFVGQREYLNSVEHLRIPDVSKNS